MYQQQKTLKKTTTKYLITTGHIVTLLGKSGVRIELIMNLVVKP